MIKNIEELKNIQIVCRNQNQVKNCLNYLEQLGFDVEDFTSYYDCCNIVFWGKCSKKFVFSDILGENLSIEFYNKELVKTLQKFIKEKEKEKQADFEVAEDKRITKINNYKSKGKVFIACDWDNRKQVSTSNEVEDFTPEFLDYSLKYGLVYATEEARDKAMFKLEIETKLKNIAERLNKGQKIDWKKVKEQKFYIYYNYDNIILDYYVAYRSKNQGTIFCLDEKFLEVAKKEIGEDNLIKYFKEDLN